MALLPIKPGIKDVFWRLMPNLPNKEWNKRKENDDVRTAHEALICTQAERRYRYRGGVTEGDHGAMRALTEEVHSANHPWEDLIEETREEFQRLRLIEESRDKFSELYTPRVKNPDEREGTDMAWGVKGAWAWVELFILDTSDERIQFDNRTTRLL